MKPDRSYTRDDAARAKLLEEDLTRKIIGAFYEVYNALGFGFLESILRVPKTLTTSFPEILAT